MKTRILLGTALLLGFFTSVADNFRCVTVAATFGGPATVQIQPGETAELASSVSTTRNGKGQTTFSKSGSGGGPWGCGIPVTGPAIITASSDSGNTLVITVKITPDSPDVNQAFILPPGTNQVHITLESSTNLVNWAAATNGVYSSPDTVRFFRISTNAPASP